jgi:hypothetical protein
MKGAEAARSGLSISVGRTNLLATDAKNLGGPITNLPRTTH